MSKGSRDKNQSALSWSEPLAGTQETLGFASVLPPDTVCAIYSFSLSLGFLIDEIRI